MSGLITATTSVIPNGTTHSILADCYADEAKGPCPLVIFCHGYKGFKDWGTWGLAMREIAKAGFIAVKFNFSLNGTSIDNPLEFVDLEAYARNTYTQEQLDLTTVIDYYSEKEFVDSSKIFLIGHSRGGGAVILQAYYNDQVTGAISWAGVADFKKRFPQRDNFDTWKETGVFYTINGRTKQEMPHYFSFWEDFEQNEQDLTIQYAAQHLKKPVLLINGTADDAVSEKEAELLHLWIKTSELQLIEGANHVFGSKHPYEGETLPEDFQKVLDYTLDFLKRHTS